MIIKFKIFENKDNKYVIAYHGSPYRFEKFSMSKRGTGADQHSVGDYGKGFYFTPNKEMALSYAHGVGERIGLKITQPTLYTVELKMNKPFDMRIINNIGSSFLKLRSLYGMDVPDEEYTKLYKDNNITEDEYNFYSDVESSIGDNWGDWNIKRMISNRGYDSLINYDGSEYIVYDTRSIKILKVEDV